MPDLLDTLTNTDWSQFDYGKLPWERMGIAAGLAVVVFPAHRVVAALAAGAAVALYNLTRARGRGGCGCSGAATPPPAMTAPPSSTTGGLDDPGALLASSAAARGGVQ